MEETMEEFFCFTTINLLPFSGYISRPASEIDVKTLRIWNDSSYNWQIEK